MSLSGAQSGARLRTVGNEAKRPVKSAASRVNAVAAPERKLRDPREENVPGDFYVDSTCIGEDACLAERLPLRFSHLKADPRFFTRLDWGEVCTLQCAHWIVLCSTDCDTCRWMAPETYGRANGQSAVHLQPQSPEERKRALQALLACPS